MSQVLTERLTRKIKELNETIWENQVGAPRLRAWLSNFRPDSEAGPSESLHALFLLSQMMYFGKREMRELLRTMFRDLVRYPIIEAIRKANGDTLEVVTVTALLEAELRATRFLGMGNPSESGTHLLYFFRQENRLGKKHFINTHEMFSRDRTTGGQTLRDPQVKRFIFVDDLCGSGEQAIKYSAELLEDLKATAPEVQAIYLSLFATDYGLQTVRTDTRFDRVDCVFELDKSFKCLEPDSRYFAKCPQEVSREFARACCLEYGTRLVPAKPLGYRDGQLLIAFYHNTPDNTLPIIWFSEDHTSWVPVLRRYPKHYSWGSP